MIKQFGPNTALLLIDVQKGVDVLEHWGGPTGRRNNPDAEPNMQRLLTAWRAAGLPVIYTAHDSREDASPLKLSEPTGDFKDELAPVGDEVVVPKDVNSGFIGTNLELELRRAGAERVVVIGFFTNMCVATTVRMAGNMGFDTYLISDCCATTNRVGPDGTDHEPEVVHDLTIATLHGEFCTSMNTDDALEVLAGDVDRLERVQGNE